MGVALCFGSHGWCGDKTKERKRERERERERDRDRRIDGYTHRQVDR